MPQNVSNQGLKSENYSHTRLGDRLSEPDKPEQESNRYDFEIETIRSGQDLMTQKAQKLFKIGHIQQHQARAYPAM